MDWASSDVIDVIWYLLPGFLAAWVFYGLTAHPRRDSFERVIQAIIFTGIVQVITLIVKSLLSWGASIISFGEWTKEVNFGWSVTIAFAVGLIFSVLANYDWLHKILRALQITKRTSFPSEWFSAFNCDKRWVVLHLDGDRRLYGWAESWPDSGEGGHFVMCHTAWLLDTNEMVSVHAVDQLVIPVTTVTMVERLKYPSELTATADDIAEAERRLTELYNEESQNGEQSAGPLSAENGAARELEKLEYGGAGSNGQAQSSGSPATSAPSTAPKKLNKDRKGRR